MISCSCNQGNFTAALFNIFMDFGLKGKMTLKKKALIFVLVMTGLILMLVVLMFYRLDQFTNNKQSTVSTEIEALSQKQYIKQLAERTQYYDEVLTQSCRNYAFTSQAKYKERYRSNVKALDAIIAAALQNAETEDLQNFQKVHSANEALVAMEDKAFQLVDQGLADSAQALLDSDQYNLEKERYEDGFRTYINDQNNLINEQQAKLAELTSTNNSLRSQEMAQTKTYFLFGVVSFLILLITSIYLILQYINSNLEKLKKAANRINKGDLNEFLPYFQMDEFGELACEFDQMMLSLQEQIKQVEEDTKSAEQEKQQAAFSRELHDTLGIVISSMKILLKQMEPVLRGNLNYMEKYKQMEQLLNEAYVQVRELSNIPVPEAIIRRGLKTAINSLANRTELIFPISIQFITNIKEEDFSPEHKIATYLMIRELLNNAVKHSKCKHIVIQLIQENSEVLIMFEDDGIGISAEDKTKLQSNGLKNLNHRLKQLNGYYEVDSTPMSGTTYTIEFPLTPPTIKTKNHATESPHKVTDL
jgi:signal transduction histidine kinase